MSSFKIHARNTGICNIAKTAESITIANEENDTECFIIYSNDQTGNHALKTNSDLIFDSSTGNLISTSFEGALNGNGLIINNSQTVDMGNNRIQNVTDPIFAQEVATKSYVDATAEGLHIQESCRLATTQNITLSGEQTIDAVFAVADDRILVKDQSNAANNGVYVVSGGSWYRSLDFNESDEIKAGDFVFITEGTVNGSHGYVMTQTGTININTTPITWTQFSGAGQIVAGNGLDKNGQELSVDLKEDGGLVIDTTELTVNLSATGITGTLAVVDGGTGATSAANARTALGLTIGTHVQAYDAQLEDIAGLTPTDGNFIVGDGSNFVLENGATARASLGLTIGTHVQAYDAQLEDIAGLTPTDGNFIVGDGSNFVLENGATARASLGFTGGIVPVSLGGTGATSLTDKSVLISQDSGPDTVSSLQLDGSGELVIGGASGPAAATLTAGSNITITNGDGTIEIASSTSNADTVTNGVYTTDIGSTVQAYDADLSAIAGLTSAADKGIQFTGPGNAATFDLTLAGKALLADADAVTQRTTLGLGTISIQDSDNISITDINIQGKIKNDLVIGEDSDDLLVVNSNTTFTGPTIVNGSLTTGGKIVVDIDSGVTPATDATGINATGSITLGLGNDAGLYVHSDDLYIENKTSDKDIIFRINDGGTYTTAMTIDSSGNVGIGITNPSVALDVSGSIKATGDIEGTTINATTNFTIGNLVIADDSIVMTPSTDDTVTIAAATDGVLNMTTVDNVGTAADINLTADGQIKYRANDTAGHIFDINGTSQLSIIDGMIKPVTDNVIDLGSSDNSFKDAHIQGTATIGTATIGTATIGTVSATNLDISGDADIDGTLEADAYTVGGTALAEYIANTVGAMVGSETGIAVTYEDGDNTLDFVIAAAQTTINSLLAADIKIGEDDQTKIDFGVPNEIQLFTSSSERMRIDSSGNVGIGTDNPQTLLHISSGTAGNCVLRLEADTDNSLDEDIPRIEFVADSGNQWSAIFNQPHTGAGVNDNGLVLANGHQNGGIRFKTNGAGSSNYAAATEKMIIKGSGNVGIGTTSPVAALHVKSSTTNSYGAIEEMGDLALVLTNSDENTVVGISIHPTAMAFSFANTPGQNDSASHYTLRAYLSESATVNNLTFTGQHRIILNENINTTSKGLIVSSTGKYINLDNSLNTTINESLPICNISNIDNDKKVFGVISDKEDTNDNRTYDAGAFVTPFKKANKNEQRMFINSLGEGAVWICNKNGNIENGDYISSSSVPGYGMKQTLNEEVLTRYTVAKITCDCDFSLTKIAKQKLKVITTTETYEISLTQDIEKIKTETKIEYDETLSRYVQKEVTTTTTEQEQLYDTFNLYNESGEVIGTHQLERKETKTKTISNIDYDANGDLQYEDDLDADGNQQMIYPFETRFLLQDATQITEEEYNTKLADDESVYLACFVGCTYHCG